MRICQLILAQFQDDAMIKTREKINKNKNEQDIRKIARKN